MKKTILICSGIFFLVQACTQSTVQNADLPIETTTPILAATKVPSIPFPNLVVNNGIQYMDDELAIFSEDGIQAVIDNSHGQAGLDWYQFMNTFFNPQEPLRLRLNIRNENNRTGFILIAGQLRNNQGGPEWWRGVHELYITPYPDHVNLNFHDGRSANSNEWFDVHGIKEGEPFYLIFSDPQGNAFEVWDEYGNLVESIRLSDLQSLEFPSGFFTEGKYYMGVALERGAVFEIQEVSILTEKPLNQSVQSELPKSLQDARWIYLGGPRGGIGYDIRFHPENQNIMWVTDANAGVHKSENGGMSWFPTNEGIDVRWGISSDAIPIFTLAVSPFDPDIVWAGAMNSLGLYKSEDGGLSWVPKEKGIMPHSVMEFRGIAFDPNNPDIIYCGGNYFIEPQNSVTRGFIYKSVDGGENWTLLKEPGAVVRWIIIDPTDSDTIYISTGIFDRRAEEPEGVLKSMDGGITWSRMNNGLYSLAVDALAMHPTDPQTLVAGTGQVSLFWTDDPKELWGGVYITHNGGETWNRVDPPLGWHETYSAVAFAPSNPDIIYADAGEQFLRSIDGGKNWKIYNVTPDPDEGILEVRGDPIALAVNPTNPDIIFMNAYNGGVFLSTDGGKTWNDSSAGYSGEVVLTLEIDQDEPAHIKSGSKNGLHESLDGGEHWRGLTGWDGIESITALDSNFLDGNIILAGTFLNGKILQSSDGGIHWRVVLGPLGDDTLMGRRNIYDIAFVPGSNVVYAATGYNIYDISYDQKTVGPGLFRSYDSGSTWEIIRTGLENTSYNFLDIEINVMDPDILYLGTMDDGVYKSNDGGESWFPINTGISSKTIKTIKIDPKKPDTIFAGTEQGNIWKSIDGGESWINTSNGLPANADITSIAIDPTNPQILYVSDLFSGVYVSIDGGENWYDFNNGLDMRAIYEVVISSDGRYLYAATSGKGVFKIDLSGNSSNLSK